jgi:hypothetical protein
MVLDELDSAAAKMPTQGKKESNVAAATTASAGTQQENTMLKQSKRWWKQATSLAPTGIDSSIVKCRIQQSTQFMSKDDCLLRGGVPRGTSG